MFIVIYWILCLYFYFDSTIIIDYKTINICNILSLSQQKWIRRRLLVLLFEASKILNEPPIQFDAMIHPEQYRRRHNLESLLRCSLNLYNNLINFKAFNITLRVLCIPEIVIRIAEYLWLMICDWSFLLVLSLRYYHDYHSMIVILILVIVHCNLLNTLFIFLLW